MKVTTTLRIPENLNARGKEEVLKEEAEEEEVES